MAEDKVKYSDLVEPDDSISHLISQLDELNKQYGTMVNAIRAGAKEIVNAMKSINSSSSESRASIDENAAAASRLERAQKELKFAMSDTGKQVAWLKSQISETNRSSVEQQQAIAALDSSYNKLKLELKDNIKLWQSLSAAERQDANMGGQVLNTILNLKNNIQALDAQLKTQVTRMSEVQKAQERLNYLRSEEGQKLLAIKKEISEVLSGRNSEKQAIDQLTAAQEKLTKVKSEYNQKVIAVNNEIREANKIAKLTAQVNSAATGSYNQLAAQYELNKVKLNAMSQEERRAANTGQKLEAETLRIYKQMIVLQEATGNHTLSVGHYEKAWNGLGNAVNQIVRELPSLAINFNTFMLAISNNIPILLDEIDKVKEKNEILRAEGKPTRNIVKEIASSLFSWQTALIFLITALSSNGQAILDWCASALQLNNSVKDINELQDDVQKELESTNNSFGQSIVKLHGLQEEWKSLKTTAEKKQWIIDNKSEFDNLGISIDNVTEAENAFVNNTQAIVTALKLRAKAAAAQKLAAEQYEKALIKANEAETENKKGPSFLDRINSAVSAGATVTPGSGGGVMASGSYSTYESAETNHQRRVKDLEKEAKTAEKTADSYFDLAVGYEAEAKAALESAGIKSKIKTKDKIKDKIKDKKGKQPQDLTRTINKNELDIQKKYEESVTKLLNDEYAKRRKAAADQIKDENNQLREKYRLNEEYIKNINSKYKQLTEDQKKQIENQQNLIKKTIANNLNILENQLQQIQNEQKVAYLQNTRSIIINNTSNNTQGYNKITAGNKDIATSDFSITQNTPQIEESLIQERNLLEKNLELKYQLTIETNKKLLDAGDSQARSEEEIINELNNEKLKLWSEYDIKILSIRKQNIDDQLELVKKGSDEELQLLLKQNEIARQQALAENAAKPAEQRVSTSSINAKYDKSKTKITGSFKLTNLDEQQALDKAIFNEVEHSETEITRFKLEQEKARWEMLIKLAESGALNWSQAQIDAAKSTVKGINKQLSETDSFIANIGKNGLGGALLDKLGFSKNQITALEEAASVVVEQLNNIMQAEVDLAQQAVSNAEERVNAAQSAYEAEVEARANGYANSVATAKKELQQEKKNQREKEKILEAAQRRQEAINTITQTTSLITASALLWKSFAGTGPAAPFLAAAAIAAMWTSFAVAKVKAAQVTKQSNQQYGEGGIEFLEGGSHASGNDIDLQTKNSKGKNMRAEGGEALAIINKRSTQHYRKQLPDIIKALNKGTFEEKYLNAFEHGETLQAQIITSQMYQRTDLTKIEQLINEIKKQNSQKFIALNDGTTVEIKGNVIKYYR